MARLTQSNARFQWLGGLPPGNVDVLRSILLLFGTLFPCGPGVARALRANVAGCVVTEVEAGEFEVSLLPIPSQPNQLQRHHCPLFWRQVSFFRLWQIAAAHFLSLSILKALLESVKNI